MRGDGQQTDRQTDIATYGLNWPRVLKSYQETTDTDDKSMYDNCNIFNNLANIAHFCVHFDPIFNNLEMFHTSVVHHYLCQASNCSC